MPDEPKDDKDTHEYRIVAEQVWKELDPELQQVVIDRQAWLRDPLLFHKELAYAAEVVDVIAKLRDPKTKVEGLHVVAEIGQIVTGTVDADKIEDVRRDPNVISLKGARKLSQTLSHSVPEIRASRHQLQAALPNDPKPLDGSNVIVGIIDHGCDFGHRNFRKPDANTPDGATRILHLWDQRDGPNDSLPAGGGRSPEPYGYGREFDSEALNEALTKAPPKPGDFAAPLNYLKYTLSSGHGTSVMDIAAGNSGGKHAPGVAPGADIIFVDESDEGSFTSGDPFGNSRRLLDAVAYIFDKAQQLGRPAVVNISMGYQAGPHDGSTLIEEGFDSLLETPGRAIVIAAGNCRVHQIHIRRTLHPRRTHTLRWELSEEENNCNKMDLWYSGRRALVPILRSPGGYELGPFPLGSTYTIYRKGKRAGFIFHRAKDSTNDDNNLVIAFTPLMEMGVWELDLRLLDDGSRLPIEVHAWTELDKAQSIFPDALPTDFTCTLNALGCGDSTIVVGAYDALNAATKMEASGEGPTRDGKLKPEVSAPGPGVIAALALSDSTDEFGGTSAAAPHVTGLVALLMQSATAPLFIEDIRDFVVNTARNNPPSPEHGWDTCYGAGRVDAVESVRAQRSASQIPDAIVDSQPLAAASVVPVAGNGDVGTTLDVKGVASIATAATLATPGAEDADTSLAATTPGAASTEIGIGNDSAAKFTSPPPAEGS